MFNIDVLSVRREHGYGVGYDPIFELEEVVSSALGGRVLDAVKTRCSRVSAGRFGRRFSKGLFPSYRLNETPEGISTSGPRVLMVSALTPASLRMLDAVQGWRKDYDYCIAFVTDSFVTEWYKWTPEAGDLDHIFVPIRSDVEPTQLATGTPTSFLPFGADCFHSIVEFPNRSIDVVGYGRQPPSVEAAFEKLNSPGSNRLFLRNTCMRGSSWQAIRRGHHSTLNACRFALAYDTRDHFREGYDVSIVTPRWAECLAAGCVVGGTAPEGVREIFDWKDSHIDLPADGEAALSQVIKYLDDPGRLAIQSRLNRSEMMRAHDWRHRVATVLDVLGIDHPIGLCNELEMLDASSEAVKNRLDEHVGVSL